MRHSHYISIVFLFLCFIVYPFQSSTSFKKSQNELPIERDRNFILNNKDTDAIESFLLKTINTDTKLAENYFLYYLDRGIKQNDNRIQFIAHYYLGDISYDLGDYAQSIKHGESALEIAKKQKHERNQIIAVNQLGNIYYNIRNYDAALNQYLKAYTIIQNNDFKNLELHILGNLSMIRTRIHRYEDALSSYQKIIDLLQKQEYKGVPNYSGIYLSSIQGAGVCNFLLKKYDNALQYYEKGFRFAEQHKLQRHIIMFHMVSGEAYTAKEMYDLALDHLYKARNMINQTKTVFDPLLHTTNYHIATAFYKKQEFEKALDYLSTSFDIINSSKKETQIEKIAEMYDLAFKCAEKIGDAEKQIYYSKSYRHIIDSLHRDDIATKDKLYDQDIEKLENENQNLLSQKSLYGIITVISIFMIFGLSIYNIRTRRKNKSVFRKLQKQIEENKTAPLPSPKKDFVTDEKAIIIFEKLHDLEGTNFFLDQNCNLYNTAKQIETNTTYLSKIMNEYKLKSFNEYINELRISHCLEKLKKDKKFRSYTIKAISGELGYKSVNTFGTAFKKQTGLTHSYYLKQVHKENLIPVIEQV